MNGHFTDIMVNNMELKENPSDRKYTKEHEWVKVDDGVGTIGITDFAQNSLTDIVFVELPQIGKKFEQFKPIGIVESVKSVSDVCTPLSGEVIEVNENLSSNPILVNQDPYGQGWMVKIKLSDKDEINSLMSKDEYDKYIRQGAN